MFFFLFLFFFQKISFDILRGALIHSLEFDTSFYTNNPTKDIYSVTFVDEIWGTERVVVENLKLKGHAVEKFKLPSPLPATR